ncbi:MAG: type II toxin-antitoxin system VapC family toxin [Oscillatoriales cyanobacterium SM2_2_1]|nr:type II toxin-antitoxin system VapC family toxin [Oscillatoriales cyanobacterium SM2_2_1]
MLVYLDTSVFNRPFDDQSQPKVYLETQAVVLILQAIERKKIELIVSDILEYEIKRNPHPEQRVLVFAYFNYATHKQLTNVSISDRARTLQEHGIKLYDALHIACAEASNCDYVLTCDQRLINRCRALSIPAINPIEFILELENAN